MYNKNNALSHSGKRVLSLILAIALVFALCPASVFADVEQVKITFELGGGTLEIDGEEVEYLYVDKGSAYNLAKHEPIKEGFKFVEWYIIENGVEYPAGYTNYDEDTTVYARWEEQVKITFVFDGGTLIIDDKETDYIYVDTGAYINLAQYVPTKDGHTFDYWYAIENGDEYDVSYSNFDEDTTVYAKWKINSYTATFNTNGGTTVTSVTKDYGTELTLSDYTTTRADGEFAAWYTSSDFTDGTKVEGKYTVTDNVTFYARWAYTITFDAAGGTVNDQEKYYITVQDNEFVDIEKYVPTREGYTFGGWYTIDNGVEMELSSVTNFYMDTLVSAKWSVNTYTVDFNTDGGTAIDPETVEYGTEITLSNYTTTKEGHTFAGWYTSSDFAEGTKVEGDYTVTGDVTFYAKWTVEEETEYTVTFETNGGTSIDQLIVVDGTVLTPSDYVTTREGYTFVGWYVDNDLTIPAKETYVVSINTTLYAKWTENEKAKHTPYIDGYEDGLFRPNQGITRAEAINILYKINGGGSSSSYSNSYPDVTADKWFYTAVMYMSEIEVIDGYEDGLFRPDEPINRAELTALVVRYLGLVPSGTSTFTDVSSGYWAAGYIAVAQKNGLVEGYDNETLFKPTQSMTRAETVTLINRMRGRSPESNDEFENYGMPFSDVTESHWAWKDIMEAAVEHDVDIHG